MYFAHPVLEITDDKLLFSEQAVIAKKPNKLQIIWGIFKHYDSFQAFLIFIVS